MNAVEDHRVSARDLPKQLHHRDLHVEVVHRDHSHTFGVARGRVRVGHTEKRHVLQTVEREGPREQCRQEGRHALLCDSMRDGCPQVHEHADDERAHEDKDAQEREPDAPHLIGLSEP